MPGESEHVVVDLSALHPGCAKHAEHVSAVLAAIGVALAGFSHRRVPVRVPGVRLL